jgi:transposase-like protein
VSRDIVCTSREVCDVHGQGRHHRGAGGHRTISEVAREYGVSRRWVHELVRRFDAEGEAAFTSRSRRPHHSPQQMPARRWRMRSSGSA